MLKPRPPLCSLFDLMVLMYTCGSQVHMCRGKVSTRSCHYYNNVEGKGLELRGSVLMMTEERPHGASLSVFREQHRQRLDQLHPRCGRSGQIWCQTEVSVQCRREERERSGLELIRPSLQGLPVLPQSLPEAAGGPHFYALQLPAGPKGEWTQSADLRAVTGGISCCEGRK